MVPNDFEAFFATHPTISHVYFNGAAADKNYRRLVAVTDRLRYTRLPSTSPAHTTRYDTKLAAWQQITSESARI